MYLTKPRVVYGGVLAALFAGLISWSGAIHGQIAATGTQPAKDKDKKGKEKKEPGTDDDLPFVLISDRDAREKLKAARDYLNPENFKNIQWVTVCNALQAILEAKGDSFFNTFYTAGGEKKINRISVKTEANRIIAEFPKEGLEFYQQAYGATASAMLDDAIKANYDLAILAELSQKFFHTKAGGEATILLGSAYLERGNYLEAAYAFERVLAAPSAKPLLTPLTLFKACLSLKRSGDPKHAELLKTTLSELQAATARDGLAIGRKTYSYDQLRDEINRPLELLRSSTTVGEWTMRGGNATRAATVDGGAPFLDPAFRASMLPNSASDEEANSWIRTELEKLFARDVKSQAQGVPLPGFFPIATPDIVIFRTYSGVYGVATRDQVVNGRIIRAGDIRWISKTNKGFHQLLTSGESDDIDMPKNVKDWWTTYSVTKVTSILYENPLLGSLSHDGQNVYFVDDVALPPPPVFYDPNFGGINPQQVHRQSGDLADAIRAGRLVAVDLKTGIERWELGRVRVAAPDPDSKAPVPPPLPNRLTEEEADKSTDAFHLCLDAIFLGAPLTLNGKLYVLIEQAGAVRLLCLDPKNLVAIPGQTRKPTLVWSQKLGRPINNLPGDSIRRYQGTTLAAGEGIIVCPTNSGVIVAVDAMSRSLRWAHAYKKIDPNQNANPRTRQIVIGPNGQPIMPQQLPTDRWRSSGPMIANGRVILTAYDSDRLECLDLRSGKVLWWVPRDTSSDLYVGGIINDRVIVVGRNQVRGYHLMGEDAETQRPRVAFEPVALTNATPTGHGVGGKGVFYIPVRQENAGRDTVPAAEIWAINVETGQIVSKAGARKRNDTAELSRYGLGNLVFQDGMVFAQSAWELACYPQLEQKRAEMDRLLAANPNDPIGLLTRGELLLDKGELNAAIADFKTARKNNLPPEKQPLLREKLYLAYTELVRNEFAAAEPILAEYKALCEVIADPNEAPEDKIRRRDETDRRTRLYLYLLARGRESQGRLGEAFDNYISLANMGEARSLLEMPDEPNVRMRPDVWARGRIEAMVRRAADPAARKLLEERVIKEWNDVRSAGDLNRLRDFVAVFGPYFASGADAQLQLADTLLQTNNDADAREAQTHLAQLRVSAEEPAVRARATETLARLMVKNQMMEDAVGLYLQLGKEYPAVVIRDGKTGAEFMTRLLTDKRLLPYIEPSRYPLPTRVKAEERPGQVQQPPGVNLSAQIEIEPVGELFPMYRRYRIVLDQFASPDGQTWTLRLFDKSTGNEKMHFRGLMPSRLHANNGVVFPRVVQAGGQLLLLQIGSWVYCFDLAEKKEVWQKNLLGETPPAMSVNMGGRIPPVEVSPDGDVTVRYDDGYIITLGKSTVLQANYAALLTRDGLEVVEPLTQRVLWTRRDIKERTQIFGDGRYIVLVENDSNRRPVATRVLRAVDGLPVEGSGDSGRALVGARSCQIHGRTALLSEGRGEQPRVLRLHDLVTGKDVWKKEYDAKAVPIKSHNTEWTGFVKSNGEAEIMDVKTGKVVATLRIDEKNLETDLKPCTQAQLLCDAERYYLILDRDGSAPSSLGTTRLQMQNTVLRTTPVNGPLYAFDRSSGQRVWSYGYGLLENQNLVLEQFADMPVIMAASMVSNRQTGLNSQPIVVIEKARGRLILDRAQPFEGQPFQKLTVNPKNGQIELDRNNMRVIISADDSRAGVDQ